MLIHIFNEAIMGKTINILPSGVRSRGVQNYDSEK